MRLELNHESPMSLVKLNACSVNVHLWLLFSLSKMQLWLFAALVFRVQKKYEEGDFQFVSVRLVFLQAGQSGADQQEIHLLNVRVCVFVCVCVCARVPETAVQRSAGKSQQAPDRSIFRT